MSKIPPITQSATGPRSRPNGVNRLNGANASSPSNTASLSRCTSPARADIRITAMENSAGNTSPIAVSSRTSPVRLSNSTSATVASPTMAAPAISSGDRRSATMKNASTMPNKTVWLMASLIMDIRRSIKKRAGNRARGGHDDRDELNLELRGRHGAPASVVRRSRCPGSSRRVPRSVSTQASPDARRARPCAASSASARSTTARPRIA